MSTNNCDYSPILSLRCLVVLFNNKNLWSNWLSHTFVHSDVCTLEQQLTACNLKRITLKWLKEHFYKNQYWIMPRRNVWVCLCVCACKERVEGSTISLVYYFRVKNRRQDWKLLNLYSIDVAVVNAQIRQ
jgi:hypothetical protein